MDLSPDAHLAVRLANAAVAGKDATGGGEDGDTISTLDGLRNLLAKLEFPDTRATRADLDAIRGLRTEFREIFAACATGNGTTAVDRLNALLIRHPVHPQISGHDGQPWHLHLTQGGSVADRYAAASAMGLAATLTSLGIDRLGICAAPACQHVFVDASSNRSRRYCGERCSSRANVRAFPARRRAGTVERTDVRPTAAL